MIHMGLLNVLIKRLETGIKDLKETHTTDRSKVNDVIRTRECDDDIDVIFPKRVKIECTSPRCIPVSIDSINLDSNFYKNLYRITISARY